MKYLLLLIPGVFLLACNNGTTPTNVNPIVTLLTESQLNESTALCYTNLPSYASNVAAINNNGVVTGYVQSDPSLNCLQQAYLWDSSNNKFSVIPVINSPIEGVSITGARVAALSTNLISGGVTIGTNSFEFATYNNNLTPYNINGYNYIFGISEQGQYITGSNIGGQPLLYDTIAKSAIDLYYDNMRVLTSNIKIVLYTASNTGIAVGTLIESSVNEGVVCTAVTATCTYINGGEESYFSFIKSISSDGSIIYGYSRALSGNNLQLFRVNPFTNEVTMLLSSYYIYDNVVTDDGLVVVDNDNNQLFIYDPKVGGVYSIQEVADKLQLPANTNLSDAYLSPNGHYLAFDTSSYTNNVLGVKVYFPNGIANYLETHLSPVN